MFRKISLIVAAALIIYSIGVSALGLGEISLNSGLNQPLKAEIVLFSSEGMSEYEVAASLASMTEFEKAGIDYYGNLKNIRFKTVKRGDDLVVELSSRQPIKEPFLNFLVELNWPKGRMLREYTLLLDPPVFSESASSSIEQATGSAQTTADNQPVSQPANQSSQAGGSAAPANNATPAARPPSYTGNAYGPVGQNETLWRIATTVRPDNATIHQTLVALYRANPSAFLNNNINKLKQNVTLEIPSNADIVSTPHRAALRDVVARVRQNNPSTVLDTANRSSSNRNVVRGEDRLRLATPGQGGGDEGSGTAQELNQVKSQLVESREAAATLEAENEELRRKLQDALAKIEQQSSGVAVNSAEAAALANQDDVFAQTDDIEQNGTEDKMSDAMDDGSLDSQVGSASSEPEATADDMTSDQDSSSQTEAADSEQATTDTSVADPNASDTVARERSKPTITTVQPQPVEPSFFDDPLKLYGSIGALVVLFGALGFFWRMRQRMSDEEFQDDLVVSAQGNSFDTESIDLPGVGDDLLGDLDSDSVFEGDSATEADALGEADIYIAYGKYEQAEKLLLDAIDEQPERTDLKVKLLECYAETKDKQKFDSVEQQFNDVWDFDLEAAAQVREIKQSAWPSDSDTDDEFELPSTEEIFGENDSADLDDEFSLDDLDTESDVSLDDDMGSSNTDDSFDTDDFDFDLESDDEPQTAETEADSFDLDSDDGMLDAASDSESDDFSLDDDLLSLDGDDAPSLDDDLAGVDSAISSDAETVLDISEDDINMELDDDDFDLGDDSDLDDD
ncbi:MAG: FimV/HubP family polar landmark protein, partial [Kangiellaceae bacterium]|nr:FimV/HubP family polar landmark protein [Kangiellaceae bacterium]